MGKKSSSDISSRIKKNKRSSRIKKKRSSNNKASSSKPNEASSPTSVTEREVIRPPKLDVMEMMKLTATELRDNIQLCSIDDAFHLPLGAIDSVLRYFERKRLPCPITFNRWDVYQSSLFLKMHACLDNIKPYDYRSLKLPGGHMESTEDDEVPVYTESFLERNMQTNRHLAYYWKHFYVEPTRKFLDGPIRFGFYSPGHAPDRIPYHLYLLVKEVVDIMKGHLVKDLTIVEEKIRFFCYYFDCHVPAGWKYNRKNARKVVAKYDPTRKPRYNMDGYNPFSFREYISKFQYDQKINLTRQDMIAIMCIIHSRKTPDISGMCPEEILFYCRICSCFGIDYHRLEAAAADDVCLMNVGLVPSY